MFGLFEWVYDFAIVYSDLIAVSESKERLIKKYEQVKNGDAPLFESPDNGLNCEDLEWYSIDPVEFI